MEILSEDKLYAMGIKLILSRFMDESSQSVSALPVTIYITTGVSFINLNRWMMKYPPNNNSIFICNVKVQEYITRRYKGKVNHFIAENASVNDVEKGIKNVISQELRNKKDINANGPTQLTQKQQIITAMMLLGYDVDLIAIYCNSTVKTIYSHRRVIMKKIRMNNIQEFYFLMKGDLL